MKAFLKRKMCTDSGSLGKANVQERGGARRPKPLREYFYYVDLHGRLYLDGTDGQRSAKGRPKVYNIATCLKEPKFLDFFFRQMRVNNLPEGSKHRENGYNFLSPCGRELNFVRAADTALVFSRLSEDRFFYAPSLSVPFDKTALMVSPQGRMYHPAPASVGGECLSAHILQQLQLPISNNCLVCERVRVHACVQAQRL